MKQFTPYFHFIFRTSLQNGRINIRFYPTCSFSTSSQNPKNNNNREISILTLPCIITSQDAATILSKGQGFFERGHIIDEKFLSGTTSQPNDSSSSSNTNETFILKYLPFHGGTFTNLTTSFTGKYGIDRTEYNREWVYDPVLKTMKWDNVATTVTDWYNINGKLSPVNYFMGRMETHVYAGFNYPRREVEAITIDTEKPELLKNSLKMEKVDQNKIDRWEMRRSFGLEKMSARLYDTERERIRVFLKDKYRADHDEITTINIHFDECQMKLESYHIPVYVYEYEYSNEKFCKFVNAFSGHLGGTKIYSPIKIFALAAPIGGLVGGVIAFWLNPVLTTSFLLKRAAFSAASSGILSALWSRYTPIYQQAEEKNTRFQEREYNDNIPETEADRKRRIWFEKTEEERYQKQNESEEWFWQTRRKQRQQEKQRQEDASSSSSSARARRTRTTNLPKDKCKLLGLDPYADITLEEAKQAYFTQLKKWHPDKYRGSNEKLAVDMTQRLNEAYQEISSKLKK